jgi:predicted RNA-binding protein YlqC (UPF0109 family)
MKPYSQTLKKILDGLVSYPSDLRVTDEPDRNRSIIGIRCNDADQGLIRGKHARMITSLQLLFKCIGERDHVRLWISLADRIGNTEHPSIGKIVRQWNTEDEKTLRDLLFEIVSMALPDQIDVEVSSVGAHRVYKIKTDWQIPVDLFDAIRTIFSAWARANGGFVEIRNDYQAL